MSFSYSREANNIDDRLTLNVQMIAMILWWLPWSCDDCHDLVMIAMILWWSPWSCDDCHDLVMIAMILWWLPWSYNDGDLFPTAAISDSCPKCPTGVTPALIVQLHSPRLSYCHIFEKNELKSLCIHVFSIVCLQQLPHFTFPVFQSQRFLAVL